MKYYITPEDDDSRHYDAMMFDSKTPEVTLALLVGDVFLPSDLVKQIDGVEQTTIYVSNDVFDRCIWDPANAYLQESIRRFMGPLLEDRKSTRLNSSHT